MWLLGGRRAIFRGCRQFGTSSEPPVKLVYPKWSKDDIEWFIPFCGTIFCFAAYAFITSGDADKSITTWAKYEAEERLRRIELGLPIEMGESYSEKKYLEGSRYEKPGVGERVEIKEVE